VIISQLPLGQLAERLAGPGVFLSAGPFVFQIQTRICQISEGVRLLYANFPIGKRVDFADFHIRFLETRNWWPWVAPHLSVEVDGGEPAVPVPLGHAFAAFEGCLNWCIYTHCFQYLIIHAAAIERDGRAALLPAPPGSGKSTLCAALVNRGWRLLTDELTLIDTNSGMVVPLARPISLKNESIGIIRQFAPDAVFGPVCPDTIKGTISHMKPPAESVARVGESCPVAWLIVPSYQLGGVTNADRMTKAAAFMRVAESAVNYMTLGQLGFDLVSNLVDEAVCYKFEYSNLHEAVSWFDNLSGQNEGIGSHAANVPNPRGLSES